MCIALQVAGYGLMERPAMNLAGGMAMLLFPTDAVRGKIQGPQNCFQLEGEIPDLNHPDPSLI